jgi:hypothetical protein
MDSNQEKIASIAKLEEKLDETIQHQMQHFLSYVNKSTQKLPGTMEIDPDPRMMPSAEAHHEIPNRESAVNTSQETEEVAEGLQSGRRALPEEAGSDPRKL